MAKRNAAPAAESTSPEFDWPVCHEAEHLLATCVEAFLSRNSFARRLAARMQDETGNRLLDAAPDC